MRFNGRVVEGEWIGTRALHYGDGVFRTALVLDGRVIDRELQIAKLASDADALDLDLPDPDALNADIEALLDAGASGVLRILLSRRDSGRGYAPTTRLCDRWVQLKPLPDHPRERWSQGIAAGWSKLLLGIQPRLAGIKHLNRLEQVLASRGWPDDQHEVVMCDAEGRVTCGSRSNLFFVIDRILVTPDLGFAGVAGMMRDKLVRLARETGIGCEIGLISPDEVRHASEAFATNSLVGIWPIRRIGSLEFPAPGPLTQALMRDLNHPWSGC
jgi:4-amino-4-deoxychorismate lyase